MRCGASLREGNHFLTPASGRHTSTDKLESALECIFSGVRREHPIASAISEIGINSFILYLPDIYQIFGYFNDNRTLFSRVIHNIKQEI